MAVAKMTRKIAFRSIDSEGDTWCEHAFLFEDDNFVRAFFYATNPLLIEIFADSEDKKDRVLNNFKTYESPAERIVTVTFTTEHAGDVVIKEMSDGYVLDITPFSTARHWPGGTTVPIKKEPIEDKYITIKVEEGDYILKSYEMPLIKEALAHYHSWNNQEILVLSATGGKRVLRNAVKLRESIHRLIQKMS